MLSKPQKLTVGLFIVVFVLIGGLVAFFRFVSGNSNTSQAQTLGEQITVPSTPEPTQSPIVIPPQDKPIGPTTAKATASKKPVASATPTPSSSPSPTPTPYPTPEASATPTPAPSPTESPSPSPSASENPSPSP